MSKALTADSTWVQKLENDLSEKADGKLTDEKIKTTTNLAGEAKAIALAAKHRAEQPHICSKEDVISEFKDWTKLLRTGIFILTGFAIAAVGAWYVQQLSTERTIAEVKGSVEEQKRSTTEIQKTVTEMREAQSSFEKEQKVRQEISSEKIEGTIRETIKSAMKENRKGRSR